MIDETDFRTIPEIAVDSNNSVGYIISTDHKLDSIRISKFNGEAQTIYAKSPHKVEWISDGHLCFLSSGPVTKDIDSNWELNNQFTTPQLWTFDLTGNIEQCTSVPPGILSYDWEPGGERLVVESITSKEKSADPFRSKFGTERMYHKFAGNRWFDTVSRALFIINSNGEITAIPNTEISGALGPVSGLQPNWGNSGIAFVTDTNQDESSLSANIVIVDPSTGDYNKMTDDPYHYENPTWSPEGKELAAFRVDLTKPRAPRKIALVNEIGGNDVVKNNSEVHITANGIYWSQEDQFYVLAGKDGKTGLYSVTIPNNHLKKDPEVLPKSGSISDLSVQNKQLWYVHSSLAEGVQLRQMKTTQSGSQLIHPDIQKKIDCISKIPKNTEVNEISWLSDDECMVKGFLYTQRSVSSKGLIVSIHGGPVDYAEPTFSRETMYWLKRGYSIFEPNYRGSASFGSTFAKELQDHWNDIEVRDILSGIDFLISNKNISNSPIFLKGFSHGGTIVAYLLAASDRFCAAVAGNAVYDFRAVYGSGESPYRFEAEFGLPWENPMEYSRISPVDHVADISTPLLLFTGMRDWHAPFTQADQFFTKLRRVGVASRLVVEPATGHSLPSSYFTETENWFSRHYKNEVQ